jgi:hypothetical protein
MCVFKWPIFWEIWPIFRLNHPGFGWPDYQWMRPNYRWIRPNYRWMRTNFGFSEDYCFFHTNTFWPNFSEFHRIFSKIDGIDHLLFFLLHTNFQALQVQRFHKRNERTRSMNFDLRAFDPVQPMFHDCSYVSQCCICIALSNKGRY